MTTKSTTKKSKTPPAKPAASPSTDLPPYATELLGGVQNLLSTLTAEVDSRRYNAHRVPLGDLWQDVVVAYTKSGGSPGLAAENADKIVQAFAERAAKLDHQGEELTLAILDARQKRSAEETQSEASASPTKH